MITFSIIQLLPADFFGGGPAGVRRGSGGGPAGFHWGFGGAPMGLANSIIISVFFRLGIYLDSRL